MKVPVMNSKNEPLMPTKPSRARKWVDLGKATPFWNRGVWCVRLNEDPSGNKKQEVACGVDPGSKMEGFSVKSEKNTFINVQAKAKMGVKRKMKKRAEARRRRRLRNCPNRKPKKHAVEGSRTKLPPSTKARWQWKLRVCKWLSSLYPISTFVVEDVKSIPRKGKGNHWNKHFSPVQVGKNWFYDRLKNLGEVIKRNGYETAKIRKRCNLPKTNKKTRISFDTHCVDSWTLAWDMTGGNKNPDFTSILYLEPMNMVRRQLHQFQPNSSGNRDNYGGTKCMSFSKGDLIKHEVVHYKTRKPKSHGVCYVGGKQTIHGNRRILLKDVSTGKGLSQSTRPKNCKFLTHLSWRFRWEKSDL